MSLIQFPARGTCDVSSCYKHRTKYSRYCHTHSQQAQRTGHPTLGNLKSDEMSDWYRLAREACALYPEDTETLRAWMQVQLDASVSPNPYQRPDTPKSAEQRLNGYLHALREQGAPIETLAARACAVLAYQEFSFARRMGRSDEFLYVQLGGILFKTRPLPKKRRARGRKVIMDKHGDMALKPRRLFGQQVYQQSLALRERVLPEIVRRKQALDLKRKRRGPHGDTDGPRTAMVTAAKRRPSNPRDGVIWKDPATRKSWKFNKSFNGWAELV